MRQKSKITYNFEYKRQIGYNKKTEAKDYATLTQMTVPFKCQMWSTLALKIFVRKSFREITSDPFNFGEKKNLRIAFFKQKTFVFFSVMHQISVSD